MVNVSENLLTVHAPSPLKLRTNIGTTWNGTHGMKLLKIGMITEGSTNDDGRIMEVIEK